MGVEYFVMVDPHFDDETLSIHFDAFRCLSNPIRLHFL